MLGPSGKGVIALITNYFMILVTFFTFGMSEGIVYYQRSHKYHHGEIFSSILYGTVLTSLVVILLSMILKDWIINSFLKNVGESNYFTALLIFPTFYFFLFLRKVLLSYKNLLVYNLAFISRAIIVFLLYVFLIPYAGIKGGILSMVIGLIVVDITGTLYIYSRYGKPTFLPNISFVKDTFIFGIKSQIGLILNFVDRRLDMFIINIFLNPTFVGYYAIAVALAELPWHISAAVGTVLFPEVADMKKTEAMRFVSMASRNSLFITSLAGVLLLISGGVLIKLLFGPQFLLSLFPLRILIPGVIALGLNRVLCGGFSGLGKPEYGTYTVICSSIITVVLDLILIPRMGINGAALASTIAYITSAIVGIIIFQRISHCNILNLLFVTKSDFDLYPPMISKILRRSKK